MLVSADACAFSWASSSATRAASASSDPAVALSSSDAKSASSLLCCACASLPCVSRGLVAIKTAVKIKCKGQRWTFRGRKVVAILPPAQLPAPAASSGFQRCKAASLPCAATEPQVDYHGAHAAPGGAIWVVVICQQCSHKCACWPKGALFGMGLEQLLVGPASLRRDVNAAQQLSPLLLQLGAALLQRSVGQAACYLKRCSCISA